MNFKQALISGFSQFSECENCQLSCRATLSQSGLGDSQNWWVGDKALDRSIILLGTNTMIKILHDVFQAPKIKKTWKTTDNVYNALFIHRNNWVKLPKRKMFIFSIKFV